MDRFDDESRAAASRFGALFPLKEGEEAGAGPVAEEFPGGVTPRNAHLLYVGLSSDLDSAELDLVEHRDRPVTEGGEREWHYFDRLPRITWHMGRSWRKRFAGAIRDLARDLDTGQLPLPRSRAEEMALHLGIESAAFEMGPARSGACPGHDELPELHHDYDFELVRDLLFEDEDIEFLFEPETEGFAAPTHPTNQRLGIGDMRPVAWFDGFDDIEQRAKP